MLTNFIRFNNAYGEEVSERNNKKIIEMHTQEEDIISATEVLVPNINSTGKTEKLSEKSGNTPEGAVLSFLDAYLKVDTKKIKKYLPTRLFEALKKGGILLKLKETGKTDISEEFQEKYVLYLLSNIWEDLIKDSGPDFEIIRVEYIDQERTKAVVKIRYKDIYESNGKWRWQQVNYLTVKEKDKWKYASDVSTLEWAEKFLEEYPDLIEKEKQRWAEREEQYKREMEEEKGRKTK